MVAVEKGEAVGSRALPVVLQPLEVGHLQLELEFGDLAEEGIALADHLGQLALQPLDLRVLPADQLVFLLDQRLHVHLVVLLAGLLLLLLLYCRAHFRNLCSKPICVRASLAVAFTVYISK